MALKIGFLANTSWYLANFRMSLMEAVREAGTGVVAVAPPDDHSRRFADRGIAYRPVRFRRRDFTPWGKWGTVRQLRRIQADEGIDLMHHFTLEAILAGTLAAGRNGPRIVHSVTGMGFVFSGNQPGRVLLRSLLKPLLRHCLRRGPVIVENAGDRAAIRRIIGKAPLFPVECIPGGGVDTKRFRPEGTRLLGPAEGRIRFLSAGRLLRDKGAGLFVEAARRYDGPPAEFLLAGDIDEGNPDSYRRSEVDAWRTVPGFRWLGTVADMPGLLRSVDVLVHPTFYGEGLPRILMEAEACGLPVIATDIPACREAVEPETNGWILGRRDPDALARLLREAAEDREARARMGVRNRRHAESRFAEDRANAATIEIYRSHFPGLAGTAS